jgi:hypothetical protein
MLRFKAFENPLSSVPLLRRRRHIPARMAAITGISGPSFGLPGGFDRT